MHTGIWILTGIVSYSGLCGQTMLPLSTQLLLLSQVLLYVSYILQFFAEKPQENEQVYWQDLWETVFLQLSFQNLLTVFHQKVLNDKFIFLGQ